MPHRNNDDVARALEQLASGKVADDREQHDVAPSKPSRPAPPTRPAASGMPAVSGAPAQAQPSQSPASTRPAPPSSVRPTARPKAAAFGHSLTFRRTVIPILLTGGLIMIALGTIHFVWAGDNNPMGGLPIWLVGILFLFGLLLWGVAVVNMLTVKQALAAQRAAAR